MDKGLKCETGLGSGQINRETFDQEISMCKKLNRENGGRCCWGECTKCGVIPLLHKLHKGRLYEDANDIEELKNEVFK